MPKGLNIYPQHNGGTAQLIPFFSPYTNLLCYPFVHPYGRLDFKNGTVPLVAEPKKLTEEEMAVR